MTRNCPVPFRRGTPALRVARPGDASRGAEALAHLLACLDNAVRALTEVGCDVDARVIEAHRAQLARGREWPGDEIEPWQESDEQERRLDEVRRACRMSPTGPVM